MGICSVSRALLTVSMTISVIVYTVFLGVFMFCSSVLINPLNVSHSFSSSVLTGFDGWMRGAGTFTCGVDKTCCSGCSLDWAVSLIDPSLLLWSLSDRLDHFGDSFPDLDLELFFPELPFILMLGIGSLIGSKRNLSKGMFANICSLYILNSWNFGGPN